VSSLCPTHPPTFLKKFVKDMLIVLKIKTVLLGIVISCLIQVLECNNAKYFSKKRSHFETLISLLLLKERKNLLHLMFSHICGVNSRSWLVLLN